MATLEKREQGWRVKIRKGGVSQSATFRTKAEASAWAAKVESDIAAGKIGKTPNKTFGELLQKYSDEISATKRGARWEQLRIALYLREYPGLCNTKLADLGPDTFAAWRDERLKSVSALSVIREWAILQHACSVAVKEWRWLQANPLLLVKRPAATPPRSRRPTQDETNRIIFACGYSDEVPPATAQARVAAAWLFAIETAMRAAELCGLTDGDVDFKTRLAYLPKTKNGHPRHVPLSKEAIRLLRHVRTATEGSETIFDISPAILDALFRKAKERALIDELHFHDSRREALTRLAKKVDVMTLAKISGHRDLRILQNTYYAPDMSEVARELD